MKKRYITAICFFIAFLFGVSAYTLFDKDSVFSARENRELSKMPYFTLENYADASFMKNFEAYYNDTFPIRDNLIDATRRIDSAFYLNFLIGDDDVLVIPTSQGAVADENGEKPENVGGCMIYNNHIMEIFKKSEENTEKYADIVNKLTKESGLDEVYVMVPPPSYALYAPGDCANDYLEATDLLKSKLETAKFIDLYDTFREHSDENIIFRTDHHWTERGAYYAANEFLKEAEYESLPPLDEYESGTKKGFLGSLYKLIMSNKESMIFEKKPDSVEYFYPMHKTKVYNYQNSLMTSPEER